MTVKLSNVSPSYTASDIARERAKSPVARALCHGSRVQLMVDAGKSVQCPLCLMEFTEFETQKNRSQVCPIVPGHRADPAGATKVMIAQTNNRDQGPRPY